MRRPSYNLRESDGFVMKNTPTPLDEREKQILVGLTYHEGFAVLKRMMERRVQAATVAVLDVKPDDPNRSEKLNNLQLTAFAMDTFCGQLMEDINWQLAETVETPDDDTTFLQTIGYIKKS
jgi:hypothetical protein